MTQETLARRRPLSGRPFHALVFIGRFQPFHLAHRAVVDRALELADHALVLVGSANAARSLRNPLTFSERAAIIGAIYPKDLAEGRLILSPLDDQLYNDTGWVESAQAAVRVILGTIEGNRPHVTLHGLKDRRIGLIGWAKDHTSYYLKMFPKPRWESVDVPCRQPISATDIRHALFDGADWDEARSQLPESSARFMEQWRQTKVFAALARERDFVRKYRAQFVNWPYASGPVHLTADAVVVQSGHVLLVRRKAMPGEGMLALPGGFLNDSETVEACALRELREETRIDVPERVLRGSLAGSRLFDDPNRSSRGRVVTQAFLFRLEDRPELPKVKGGDDAARALWAPLADLDPAEFFEDHWHIIRAMTSGL